MNKGGFCFFAIVVLSTCYVTCPAQSASQPDGARSAKILLTATGKDQKQISSLGEEDLSLSVNGRPGQITQMTFQRDPPTFLALVLDISASQEKVFPATKRAALDFVQSFVRSGKDYVSVVSVAKETTLEVAPTDDTGQIASAIGRLNVIPTPPARAGSIIVDPPARNQMPAGSTSLWDALRLTSERVMVQAKAEARRAIVLFSDGIDTSSETKRSQVLEQANRLGVAIYVVGVGDEENFGIERGTLKKTAERTGGRAYFPKREIAPALDQITSELRGQYVVIFSPGLRPGKEGAQNLKVDVVNREKKKERIDLAYPRSYSSSGR